MSSILSLDIGEKRIGVAVAEPPIYLPHALETMQNDDEFNQKLIDMLNDRKAEKLVIGYPRNQSGEKTKQTEYVENLVSTLKLPPAVQVVWQDEFATSIKAEAELEERAKPYQKKDVDALAALYILEDYLKENR
jgi:putative Holliday junction resolvase